MEAPPTAAHDPAGAVAAHLAGYRVRAVAELGRGLENTAYVVNGQLVVRYPHHPEPAAIRNEVELLARVAEISPLPVPDVAFHDDHCLAYWLIKGRPLEDTDAAPTAELGELLRRLHAMPVDEMRRLVDVDHDPPVRWRDEAAEIYERHRAGLAAGTRAGIERFLAGELPGEPDFLVFSHNDLGIEHVLVDGGEITGIIDWSDAAICDPAYDYGLLIRDLGARAPEPPPYCRERALFYARCSAIEDLDYGRDRGLRWLF